MSADEAWNLAVVLAGTRNFLEEFSQGGFLFRIEGGGVRRDPLLVGGKWL